MLSGIITFAACLGLLIAFKQIDKSNTGLTKVRRFANKTFDDFHRLSENELRKFKDATIQMDILVSKSNSIRNHLENAIGEIEAKFNDLVNDKEYYPYINGKKKFARVLIQKE